MADWNYPALPTVDAPVTAEWGATVQENPVALAEGAAGAPRISGLAIKGAANGTVVVMRSLRPGLEAPVSQVGSEALGFTSISAGEVTARVEVRGDVTASVGVVVSFYVGNTEVSQQFITSGAWTIVNYTVPYSAGDYVSIFVQATGVSGIVAYRNPLVLASERVVLGA